MSCNSETKTSSQDISQNKELKRYKVKSGIITFNTETNGKVMGSIITGSGTEKLYFKDWGAIELLEEESTTTTKMKMFGKKSSETENVHTIAKLDNGESYHVDFKKKEIYAGRDMAMDMVKLFHPTSDAGETGKGMADSMGGKVIGNETFLGYDCEIYDLMGSKQWIYKGVTLKMEVTVMGITTIKTATSAKFDLSVSDSYFELPDFPIVKMEGYQTNEEFDSDMEDMDENIDALKNMSFEEWKKIATENDEEMQNMSDEELRETYDMLQKMLQMRN
ncbi:MAG: hypothetical protein QM499_11565 [Flavobacteriaceae bacterium]